MLALGAVEPDGGRGILDRVGKIRGGNGLVTGIWDITGPESIFQRLTWGTEGSLCDGVVFGPETKRDCVTLIRCQTVRVEDELASCVADRNEIFFRKNRACESRSRQNGRKMHFAICFEE